MDYEHEVRAAWRRFRPWLADRVDDLDGEIRIAWGADLERYVAIGRHRGSAVVEVDSWDDSVVGRYAARDCDRLAAAVVGSLRDQVVHPSFLQVDGVEWADPAAPAASAARSVVEAEAAEPLATTARSPEHLSELVEAALDRLDGRPWRSTAGEEVALSTGRTILFVGVDGRDPVVHLEAELVRDVRAPERLGFELNRLNEAYPFTFVHTDGVVAMRERVVAQPFAPAALRSVVAEMLAVAEEVSETLAARLDGIETLADERPARLAPAAPGLPSPHAATLALVELSHVGGASPAEAAQLFGHDPELITEQIGLFRNGGVVCPTALKPVVLETMRHALRVAVAAEAVAVEVPDAARVDSVQRKERRGRAGRPGRRRRSRQLTLLPEEGTLDGGVWDAS